MTPQKTTTSHGGARKGAGRKAGTGRYGELTRQLRIPESQVPTVLAYLEAYRQPTQLQAPVPLAKNLSVLALPAFASQVPAGFPSPADDYLDDAIDLNHELVIQGHEAATFVLRVSGWSMMNAGIFDGDRVIVDRALNPQQSDVVVAILNGDLTIKRLGKVDNKPALLPENPHFKPILLHDADTLEIWGVVTGSLRQFRRG